MPPEAPGAAAALLPLPGPAGPQAGAPGGAPGGFEVSLDNFSGPFDLLISLIAKHRLDVTEIALAQVTDEFIAHIGALGSAWELSQASEFLVVAATLVDLKAASLLPGGLAESEDLELLEARDLLFARLLEYRAFKEVSGWLGARLAAESRRRPREVALEPQFARLLPELVWSAGPAELAAIAAAALARPPRPAQVPTAHLHAPAVSVAGQARALAQRLAALGQVTFRALVDDAAGSLPVIVARFIALLEMFRLGLVGFAQPEALGELTVSWTGAPGQWEISEEFGE
ncbi:MAG: segregation/condensation protein A [Bifidobacteriaceae bacterium]|jgi:segregation and condensation protein A|nr:segregation/condensation protein A [Bifidobacteriaceae bacterium]